jgi:hypothetical protein
MPYEYTHLMGLSRNELHNKLLKRKIPPLVRDHIKATVEEQKAALKSDNAHKIAVGNQWEPILNELRRERESVRSSLKHARQQGCQARIDAFEGYSIVLERLKMALYMYKREGHTPAKLSVEKEIPNGGIHWVDWIKPKIMNRVYDLFAAIPPVHGTKLKEPFIRCISVAAHREQKATLRLRTVKELGLAESEYEVHQTDKRKAKVDLLRKAVRLIDRMLPTDPVPRHYSGLEGLTDDDEA